MNEYVLSPACDVTMIGRRVDNGEYDDDTNEIKMYMRPKCYDVQNNGKRKQTPMAVACCARCETGKKNRCESKVQTNK